MDFQVRISAPAIADFENILAYSWINFPSTTEQFGNAILDHIEILKTFPYVGSPVANRPEVRQLIHTPIVIYYSVHQAQRVVEILHFWHGARTNPR